MRKLLKGKITIPASLLLVLAACGAPSPDAEAAATQPDRVVEIDLNEFTIEANSFEFAAGETVEFVVTNSGEIEHELRLSNQARVNAHLEGGHDDHEDSMSGEEIPHKDDEAPPRGRRNSRGRGSPRGRRNRRGRGSPRGRRNRRGRGSPRGRRNRRGRRRPRRGRRPCGSRCSFGAGRWRNRDAGVHVPRQ